MRKRQRQEQEHDYVMIVPLIRKCNCGGELKSMISHVPNVRAFQCGRCYETAFEFVNPMALAMSKLSAFLQQNGINIDQCSD